MSIASIKKRCWKILFAILLVTNQLTISSNAHSAESPRFTQQQKPLQMENPANNSNERPKMIPPWLTKANKVMDGIKNRNWHGGRRWEDFQKPNEDLRLQQRKELVDRVANLEERLSKLSNLGNVSSFLLLSNETMIEPQHNNSNYNYQQQIKNAMATMKVEEQMKELEKKFQQILSEIKANNITKKGVTSQQMTELEAKNEDQDENIVILKAAKTRLNSEVEFLKAYTRNQTNRITRLEKLIQQRNGNSSETI